jgi:hypothetical protein
MYSWAGGDRPEFSRSSDAPRSLLEKRAIGQFIGGRTNRLKGFEPSTFCMAINPAAKSPTRQSGGFAAPS